MPETNQPSNRRTVLKLLGSGVAAVGGVVGSTVASGRDTAVETLRGSPNSPLASSEIRKLRNRLLERHVSTNTDRRVVLTDLEETVEDSRVLGYNITVDDAGVPREQFATRDGVADAPGVGTQQTDRLHDEADEMLERATSHDPTPELSTRDNHENWYEWLEYGHTDMIHEFSEAEFGARPGRVTVENSVRRDRDADRIGTRTRARMEPGRQLCESDVDGFCTSPVHVEYKNKSAEVVQDWDMPVNSVPTEELLTGIRAAGVADTGETRLASIDLDISKPDPAGWVSYESGVSVPGAELIDATSISSGQSRHKFSVDSPASVSSGATAAFQIGSVAEWDPDYGSDPVVPRRVLTVDAEFSWGLSLPVVSWASVSSNKQVLSYITHS